MKCELCGKEYKRLGHHVKHTHKVDLQIYFDKYLKTPEDGKCIVCSKPTEFLGENRISAGYSKFCSDACRQVHYKQMLLKHYGVMYLHLNLSKIRLDRLVYKSMERLMLRKLKA